MRRFKSVIQAQRLLGSHTAISNLFNLGRHLVAGEVNLPVPENGLRENGSIDSKWVDDIEARK